MSDDGETLGWDGTAGVESWNCIAFSSVQPLRSTGCSPVLCNLMGFDLLNFDIWIEMYFIDNHSPRIQFSNTQ